MAKRLGDNPLFQQQGSFDAEKEREALGITVPEEEKRRGRPKNEDLIRDNPAQEGLTADWTRATFIVRKGHLEKLKDYAYTERLTLKEALDKALGAFLDDKNDLLPHRYGRRSAAQIWPSFKSISERAQEGEQYYGETLDLKYEIQALKARIQELEARLND